MVYIYYLHQNQVPFYVGKAIDVKRRLNKHKIDKGENISLVVIDEVLQHEWRFWETYWICQFKCLGFTLDRLNFGNAGSHWTFQTPNGMLFTRTENNYTNKEFDIIKMRIYVNTMSEMFISTSLWEATQD